MNGAAVAVILQKILLVILNLLMAKLPRLKIHKIDDVELGLNKPTDTKKPTLGKKTPDADKPKYKEYVSYKMNPCDKMSLAIGYFLIIVVMGVSIFYSLMQSQKINSTDDANWASLLIFSIFLDFGIFETCAITIGAILLKLVGSHPLALGRLRNFIVKYGPRAIKSAEVTVNIEPVVLKKSRKNRAKKDAKATAVDGPATTNGESQPIKGKSTKKGGPL
jgi:hypothetical protein